MICIGFAVLQLAKGAEMVMQANRTADFEAEMRGRHEIYLGISSHNRLLLHTDLRDIGTVIHAPDAFVADLTDKEFQTWDLQVFAYSGDETCQILLIGEFSFLVKHVVLALMPHHGFDAVSLALGFQLRESFVHLDDKS